MNVISQIASARSSSAARAGASRFRDIGAGDRARGEEPASGNPLTRAVVASIAAMLGYLAIDNHVELYPWNDLDSAKPQLSSTLSGVIPFSIAAAAFWRRWLPGMVVFAVWSYVWLGIQIWNWWVPYLFGGERSFASEYSRTLHPLPELSGRPGPDAQHLVLQGLSLAMAATMTAATVVEVRRRRDAQRMSGARRRG